MTIAQDDEATSGLCLDQAWHSMTDASAATLQEGGQTRADFIRTNVEASRIGWTDLHDGVKEKQRVNRRHDPSDMTLRSPSRRRRSRTEQ